MGITCCYKCEERTATCHCTCEKYLTQRAEANEEMRIRNMNRLAGEHFARLDAITKHRRHLKKRR